MRNIFIILATIFLTTIDRIKSELPLFVDAFIKQIKRNNEYLSPKIEFTA